MMIKVGDHYLMLEDRLPFEQGEVLKVVEVDIVSSTCGGRYINQAGDKAWLYDRRVAKVEDLLDP